MRRRVRTASGAPVRSDLQPFRGLPFIEAGDHWPVLHIEKLLAALPGAALH